VPDPPNGKNVNVRDGGADGTAVTYFFDLSEFGWTNLDRWYLGWGFVSKPKSTMSANLSGRAFANMRGPCAPLVQHTLRNGGTACVLYVGPITVNGTGAVRIGIDAGGTMY